MTTRSPARVLFLALLPPPVHGNAIIGALFLTVLRGQADRFAVDVRDVGKANALTDLGKRRLRKLLRVGRLCAGLLFDRVVHGPAAIAYASLGPTGVARFRDLLVITVARHVASRCLVHVHSEGLAPIMAGGSAVNRLLRWCLRGTELIAITGGTAATARSVPGHFRRIWQLSNAVADPGQPAAERAPGPARIAMIANLDPRKGVPDFIAALGLLKQRGLDFAATLVGPGTREMSLEDARALAAAAGVADRLTLTGALYDADKMAVLAGADIFAYPSRHDLAPLVLMEAMAAGAVPVAGDTGGIAEMMGPDLADLVIPTDGGTDAVAARLADRIAHLLERPARLTMARRAARTRYEQEFTLQRFTQRVGDILAADPA
jgi:glycosyltransferase involved in cell wall biosynthesis